MSHYHLEIVMPPTDDLHASVTEILHQFDENGSDEDEDRSSRHAFWDWWKIGGRWSGDKLLSMLGEDRLGEFRSLLQERKITVSGVQFGKPTLSPASQADLVDTIWRDFFPDSHVKNCPLFDNYHGDADDVMTLRDAPKSLKCDHVIIAGANYRGDGIEAKFMVRDSIWNGVTHQKTTWDETLGGALSDYIERLKKYKEDYAAKVTPTDEWIVVTIDYHS